MDQHIFDVCLSYVNHDLRTTWDRLAKNYGYVSGNALRKQFGRARKRLEKSGSIEIQNNYEPQKAPRVVCLDIETTPMLVYTFQLFDNYIPPDHVAVDSQLLAWAAKELNDSTIYSEVLDTRTDESMVYRLWDYINGANVIIGHNVRDFDIKYINTRFIHYGIPPLSSFQTIDTLYESKKHFRFSSNKLSFINKKLGIKQKLENSGMMLWVRCMDNDQDALSKMREYCEQDVFAVEELYYKLRPFMVGHPNFGLYANEEFSVCPNCGSKEVSENGYYYTSSGRYLSFRCQKCFSLSRMRKSETPSDVKKNLLRN